MPKKKKADKDFKKVRLKVGKRLPKSANFTETRFKVSQIHVQQKLSTDSEEVQGHTHNIKNLLRQLHHSGGRARRDGLSQLVKLSSTSVVLSNLGAVLSGISPLFSDCDAEVREQCAVLLLKILTSVTITQLNPFLPVIFTHISCAMTDMNENVQMDSLRFIDALLSAFLKGSSVIIKNFIELISKYHSSSLRLSLEVDPVSKRASNKWRQKILKRLDSFLSSLVSSCQTSDSKIEATVTWNVKAPVFFDASFVDFYSHDNVDLSGNMSCDTTLSVLYQYSTSLIQLLIDSWAAVVVVQKHSDEGLLVQTDAALTMSYVLNVTRCLISVHHDTDKTPSEQNLSDLVTKVAKFASLIMKGFPYSQFADDVVDKKLKTKVHVSSTLINLGVCDVLCFCLRSSNVSRIHLQPLVSYVKHLTEIVREFSVNELEIFLSICRTSLIHLTQSDFRDALMGCIWRLFSQCSHLSRQKQVLFEFCMSLITEDKYAMVQGHEICLMFLQSLPNLLGLVTSVSNVVMETAALNGLKISCARRMISLDDYVDLIIGNIALVHETNQRSIINLLTYSSRISRQQYTELSSIVLTQALPSAVSSYLLHALLYRFERVHRWEYSSVDVSNFLSFILTVITGKKEMNEKTKILLIETGDPLDATSLIYQWNITKDLLRNLASIDFLPLLDIILEKLLEIIDQHRHLTFLTAGSVLMTLQHLKPLNLNLDITKHLPIMMLYSMEINNLFHVLPSCCEVILTEILEILNKDDHSLEHFLDACKDLLQNCSESIPDAKYLSMLIVRIMKCASSQPSVLSPEKLPLLNFIEFLKSYTNDSPGEHTYTELFYLTSVL